LSPEERAVTRLRHLQVAPQQAHELWVIEQHRAALPALAEHIEMFVVRGEVEIVDIELERLADAQPGLAMRSRRRSKRHRRRPGCC